MCQWNCIFKRMILHCSCVSKVLTMANHGCTQDVDGTLLLPSKIKWYNDIDDVNPISGSSSSSTASPSSSAKPTTLHSFFNTSGNLTINSADKVAGSCQSHHTTCPSTRIADPNNTEAPTFVASSSLKIRLAPIDLCQSLQ